MSKPLNCDAFLGVVEVFWRGKESNVHRVTADVRANRSRSLIIVPIDSPLSVLDREDGLGKTRVSSNSRDERSDCCVPTHDRSEILSEGGLVESMVTENTLIASLPIGETSRLFSSR